jgi:hypothetical protein
MARLRTSLKPLILLTGLLLLPGVVAAQEPLATSGPGTVIVEWTTESEVDLAGFNIYRSESLDGPYVKINESLIPASPDPIAGGSYSYIDANAEAGVTYYYKLEDVELDGTAEMHGPITVVAGGEAPSRVPQAAFVVALLAAGLLVGLASLVLVRRVSQRRRGRGSPG